MKKLLGFLGISGLITFLFGVVIAAFSLDAGGFTWMLMQLHFLVAILLLVTWFFVSGVKSVSQAKEVVLGRGMRFGVGATTNIILVLAVLAAVNWYTHKHNKRWDLTEEGVYSLSSQSINVVSNLEKPLKLVAFTGAPQVNDESLKETLELYQYHSKKVTTEVINPQTKPHLVEKYGMNAGNIIYLEYGEGDDKGVSRINEATEDSITNAIIKLTRGAAKKIYYIDGHGEPDLEGAGPESVKTFASGIEDEHMKLEPLVLGIKHTIPDDAAAVILVSPKQTMLKEEKDALLAYADKGGRLMLFTDPRGSADVKELSEHFEIHVDDAVIIDQVQQLFAGPTLSTGFVSQDYTPHPITKNMNRRTLSVFDMAAPLSRPQPGVAGAIYSDIVKTGPNAWGETNIAALLDSQEPSAQQDPVDVKGPATVAISFEKKLDAPADQKKDGEAPSFDKTTRVIVVGDSFPLQNRGINLYSNRDLMLNMVSWLVGEEGGVSIRPKSMRATQVQPISEGEFKAILGASFLVPEAILLFGLFIWWRRRTANV